ncbi:hypothetical protein AT959_07710 [Dechloromonas denitrificans]|uniref:Uncharacterized protein n=1 Tax=Dechloromonas denitrificans TaxID=281362 RepID=A0A133XKS9_9RHOO|nr:hypothetical protein AT959_07710 [Dechloromonas denitrificans]
MTLTKRPQSDRLRHLPRQNDLVRLTRAKEDNCRNPHCRSHMIEPGINAVISSSKAKNLQQRNDRLKCADLCPFKITCDKTLITTLTNKNPYFFSWMTNPDNWQEPDHVITRKSAAQFVRYRTDDHSLRRPPIGIEAMKTQVLWIS